MDPNVIIQGLIASIRIANKLLAQFSPDDLSDENRDAITETRRESVAVFNSLAPSGD